MGGPNDQQAAGERIAKVMARAGLGSRREAEAWIAAGRVAVNGKVIASPALNVTAEDRITVDGEPLPARERTRLFLYHKPAGLVTTHADPDGRPTIFGAACRTCRAWSASGGSISTPRDCCCSPTTAGSRARSNCRRPAGCGAIACARTAGCSRPRSTGCAAASPSTASATVRSRRRSTASRAAMSG